MAKRGVDQKRSGLRRKERHRPPQEEGKKLLPTQFLPRGGKRGEGTPQWWPGERTGGRPGRRRGFVISAGRGKGCEPFLSTKRGKGKSSLIEVKSKKSWNSSPEEKRESRIYLLLSKESSQQQHGL